MKWRERRCLCGRCDSQGKGSNGDQPHHFFASLFLGLLKLSSRPHAALAKVFTEDKVRRIAKQYRQAASTPGDLAIRVA